MKCVRTNLSIRLSKGEGGREGDTDTQVMCEREEFTLMCTLNNSDKVVFLFNNIDPFICKKLGYFTFEAFQKRSKTMIAIKLIIL